MPSFTFEIARPGADPVTVNRILPDDGEAISQAKKLVVDWADASTVDVIENGDLLHREFNTAKA